MSQDIFARILQTLIFCENIDHTHLTNNSALQIYRDLYSKISKYTVLDTFFDDYSELKSCIDTFLCDIRNIPEYNENERINNLHILGKYLQDKLEGRFVKESTKDPNISREDHVINWFQKNAGLNLESDKLFVQAGFLTMFLL